MSDTRHLNEKVCFYWNGEYYFGWIRGYDAPFYHIEAVKSGMKVPDRHWNDVYELDKNGGRTWRNVQEDEA